MTRLRRHNGEARYSSNPFPTSELDVCGWGVTRLSRFTHRKDPVPIAKEAGWFSGPVLMGKKNFAPPGFDLGTVQPVACRYTNYAIPVENNISHYGQFSSESYLQPFLHRELHMN